jgi:hypothetical protein
MVDLPSLEPIGTDRPSSARMYDYFLGGSHHFAVDRAAAERVLAGFPRIADGMRANRDFLRRAVRYLVAAGVDQFLDLGSGIPTVGNVHEVAQRDNPTARVLYVDIEAIAVEHSRALLAANPYASVIQADLRRPADVLADPEVTRLLDLSRPLAVLIVGTMHFIPDDGNPDGLTPAGIVAGYRDALPSGSYLALTHGTGDDMPPELAEAALSVYRHSPTPINLRDRATVAAMFDGFTLVEPGLVPIHAWHPEVEADMKYPFAYGGVARKP